MRPKELKAKIESMANAIGASYIGVANVDTPKHYDEYLRWTEKGYAGSMWYLTEKNRKIKRGNLSKIFPNVRSALVAAFSYKPKTQGHPSDAKFARYGWGTDYHLFVKQRLQTLVDLIQKEIGKPFESKIYVDTGPILEKSLAESAGLGWIGKNTCLIHPIAGSYLFLGEILTDLELESDVPIQNHCGTCTKCLDACPTQAFVAPYQMDATKCISYHTIENKSFEIPADIAKNLNGYVAGCDICQEVCPWNNKATTSTLDEIQPGKHISLTLQNILELTQQNYDQLFSQTSFKRIPLEKLKANAKASLG